MKILVTPRSVTRQGHPSLDKLCASGCVVVFCRPGVQPSEDELCALLPGCAGYLAGVEPVTARVLDAATGLRVISRNGAGTDNIDAAAAAKHGIKIVRADGANARGVAELTIGLLLALVRRIPACDAALKRGAWERGGAGLELEGRTLGIAGCGCVGRLTARMALGMGLRVLAYDPIPDATFQPDPAFAFATLEEVLAASDFLSLHCPAPADGRPLIGTEAIHRMKPGAFLVNTARYDLIDTNAVFDALESGHLAGAALDVFDSEPPIHRRLVDHPRVIATPHVGGFTQESIDRAMSAAVNNLLSALSDR